MNKKYLIILFLILIIIVAGLSLTKGKKGTPEDTSSNIEKNGNELQVPQKIIQSEGINITVTKVNYSKVGFTPQVVTVKVGETVSWTNNTNKGMWVASNVHPSHNLYPGFDQLKSVGFSGEFSFKFAKVGTWQYHNHLSPGETGEVIVTE